MSTQAQYLAGAAAQWGSYMTSGDPGACMYGFSDSYGVQSEEHRQQCLAWIDGPCRAMVKVNDDPEADGEQLDELRAMIVAAPVAS